MTILDILKKLSDDARHFFHVVSNIRPLFWIGLYVFLMPVFAFIYWALPAGEFHIPDGGSTGYGSWLYYSIVTITTLGFGDYTPTHAAAQTFTALEVGCGILILGFFLNAVGSMKSEIDVESEIEKLRRLHIATEKGKLLQSVPPLLHSINMFLAFCYAVTTPSARRKDDDAARYNPDFTFNDMQDMLLPSGLPFDNTRLPALERLLKCAARTALALDSLQTRVDLTPWEPLLEDCFTFVANYQMFSSEDDLADMAATIFTCPVQDAGKTAASGSDKVAGSVSDKVAGSPSLNPKEADISLLIAHAQGTLDTIAANRNLRPVAELYTYIKQNAALALSIEKSLTAIKD